MKPYKLISATLFAIGCGSAMPSMARVDVDIDVAPPETRVEEVPAPRAGYVWAPGYWNYNGQQHVWAGGHWEHEHHGQHWVADSWEQHNGHYHHNSGHWEHG